MASPINCGALYLNACDVANAGHRACSQPVLNLATSKVIAPR